MSNMSKVCSNSARKYHQVHVRTSRKTLRDRLWHIAFATQCRQVRWKGLTRLIDAEYSIKVTDVDSGNHQSLACSDTKVENYIPVAIHFNHVLEFGIGNHAYGSRQRCRKLQYHAHAALSQQTKVVVFAQVGSQVERIQRVSVAVVFATNKQTFVSALSSSSGKQAVVRSYILLHLAPPFDRNGARRSERRQRRRCPKPTVP